MNFDDNLEPLAQAGEHRRQLQKIITEVMDIASSLESPARTELGQIHSRLDSDAFRVMIVGEQKRGKSTLINALLGKDVLPAYSRPCTAVVTEVRWKDEPEVELWPADGSAPVKVPFDELSSGITIRRGARLGSADTSPWKLAVVGWPLPLCENGVILIDSPGLNEHPSRQAVTQNYLNHADAIVFVQICSPALSESELQFMNLHLDTYDLFFVFNKINEVPDDEVDEVKEEIIETATAWRGKQHHDQFFFVDAKAAVKARMEGDEEKWERSSVGLFQEALQSYLVNERHKAKIKGPTRDVQRIIRQLHQRIPEQHAMLSTNEIDLRRRYDQAQAPLLDLERRGKHISELLGLRMDMLRDDVKAKVYGRLIEMSSEISDIIVQATPENQLKLTPWKVKSAAEAFATELGETVSAEASTRLTVWSKQTLGPHVADALQSMADELDKEIGTFFGELADMRFKLTGSSGQENEDNDHVFERVLKSQDTKLGGGIDNVDASAGINHILQQMVASFGVTLLWLFTPFGLIPLILGVVVANSVLLSFAKDKLDQKIRREIIVQVAEQIRSKAEENADLAAADFNKELAPIVDAVRASIQDQIIELRSQVESALQTITAGTAQVEARRQELDRINSSLNAASNELEDLRTDLDL